MCGRFASTQTDAELLDVFRAVDVVGEQLAPSYNVAPTQLVRVVLERPPRDARGHPGALGTYGTLGVGAVSPGLATLKSGHG